MKERKNIRLLLHLFDDGGEGCGFVDGEIGEDLAVKRIAFGFLKTDEFVVAKAVFAKGDAQARDPQSAHRALLGAAIAIGVLAGFEDSFFGGAIVRFAAPFETLGKLQGILASLGCGGSSLNPRHTKGGN